MLVKKKQIFKYDWWYTTIYPPKTLPVLIYIYIYIRKQIYLDDARRKIPPSVFSTIPLHPPKKISQPKNQKLSSREKPRKSKIKNAARREITEAVY